ncbi:MAG TPA: DEAD/DEAH box helicase, partial [Cyclobacteriaceae bacterium]|nr:DEAD/DEAH box helicase [Cyclobacteriaceae bacterium]
MASQIGRTDEYKSKNISLNAIQLDRTFLQTSKRIDQITEELEHFRKSLFDESECGRSVKELYLQCSHSEPFIAIKQDYSQFKFDALLPFLRLLKQYAIYAGRFEDSSYPWINRNSFAQLSMGDLPRIKDTISEIYSFYQEISEGLRKKINASPDLEQLTALSERIVDLNTLIDSLKDRSLFAYFKKILLEKSSETSALWLANVERMIMDCFAGEGPEATVPASLLGYFQKALHRSMKARKGLWSWLRWRLFSKDKIMITRALVANRLQSNKEGFKTLERKLDQRLNFEHNLSKLKNKRWLVAIPDTIERQHFMEWFARQQESIKAKSLFNSVRGLKNLVSPLNLKESDFTSRIIVLIEVVARVREKMKTWSRYLSGVQIARLSYDSAFANELINSLTNDFDALCEFDRLKEGLTEREFQVIQKLREKSKSSDAEAWQRIFLNSLCLTWIDHIETKHPELRMVSSGKMHALEMELQEQIEIKQGLSNEILLLRARERVTDDLEFNRLNNRVSYRDLLHQTTKKKKIWPLRKVISEFEDEVFKLIPCWLASPESVSAIFPMREVFDLVIFDEASQCFAERGIPALYRGKQAVVAGDHKQLRPGDFYQARWQEEDVEEPDAEVDSLLELAERYLMTVKLNGHYRSQSLELIDFSNKHFYEGRLQLLPDFHQVNQQQPAVIFDKLEGIWENNSNQVEARRVADLVLQLTDENPSREIGIVTFNAVQQSLVQDYLEEKFATAQRTLPERIFVKNIENVQGDERDIIIFSIGYAPDIRGKISVQFGSLNTEGGENRLNVAVSRARNKVIVVSSLWPEQLETGETKNAGPKLLKEYLHFAREVSSGNFRPFIAPERNQGRALTLKNKIMQSWPANAQNTRTQLHADAFPFYDLTVQQERVFKAALFTDDNFYYESLSAKAPHALLPQLLKKKNWPNLRIYSRNFWSDRKRLENELKDL